MTLSPARADARLTDLPRAVEAAMTPLPRVCVVVVNYNARRYVRACLDALLAQTYSADHAEIVVVDNASQDGSAELIAAEYGDRVRLLRNARNRGFAHANNLAIRSTPADYYALVNVDAFLASDWLAEMVAALQVEPDIAIGGCKLYDPHGLLQHAGAMIDPNGLTHHRGQGQIDVGQFDEPADVDYVQGAACLIRAQAFEELGLLSEDYFLYFEETDFCLRARRAGYRVTYIPTATAVHVEAYGSGGAGFRYLCRYHRSRLRFVAQHFDCEGAFERFLRTEWVWARRSIGWRHRFALLLAYLHSARWLLIRALACWRAHSKKVPR